MPHQLCNHLLANNLSETFQSAYRAHHSTESALLDVANCLLGDADEGRVSILNSLDLSAAFDALKHSILLARLHDMFGISGKAFKWFSSILSHRFWSVRCLHLGSLIMGFLKVLSWALLSLTCTPSHYLTLFSKLGAITTNLTMTLSFTYHRLHLAFMH